MGIPVRRCLIITQLFLMACIYVSTTIHNIHQVNQVNVKNCFVFIFVIDVQAQCFRVFSISTEFETGIPKDDLLKIPEVILAFILYTTNNIKWQFDIDVKQ